MVTVTVCMFFIKPSIVNVSVTTVGFGLKHVSDD